MRKVGETMRRYGAWHADSGLSRHRAEQHQPLSVSESFLNGSLPLVQEMGDPAQNAVRVPESEGETVAEEGGPHSMR